MPSMKDAMNDEVVKPSAAINYPKALSGKVNDVAAINGLDVHGIAHHFNRLASSFMALSRSRVQPTRRASTNANNWYKTTSSNAASTAPGYSGWIAWPYADPFADGHTHAWSLWNFAANGAAECAVGTPRTEPPG